MPMPSIPDAVNARPAKAFFVRTLTRDISLEDCILDLIDNSVDSAWQVAEDSPTSLTASRSLAAFSIDVAFGPDQFSITDNCGGITLDDAVNYAFTFGHGESGSDGSYSVGVYGIGMKRAVFKLGGQISVHSTYSDAGTLVGFNVPINAGEWLADDEGDWDFHLEPAEALSSPGVEIEVTDLHSETSARFSDKAFEQLVRQTLARDYLVPLMRGLVLRVNGVSVSGWSVDLLQDAEFAPMRDQYSDGDVSIEIIAGVLASRPQEEDPDDPKRRDDISGWYVVCNGRVVLAADRTSITGWGTLIPKWHPQYGGFVGLVFFASPDAIQLPMTTTKRSVDSTSAVYRRALARMTDAARTWITYTNDRKSDVDEARDRERQAKPVSLTNVGPSATVRLPPANRQGPQVANVLYKVPVQRLRSLADAFGSINMPYREVGQRSFEYAFEHFVSGEDD